MKGEDGGMEWGIEGGKIVCGLVGIVFEEGTKEESGCAGEDGGLWDAKSGYVEGAVVFEGLKSGEFGEHSVGDMAWWLIIFIAGYIEVRDARDGSDGGRRSQRGRHGRNAYGSGSEVPFYVSAARLGCVRPRSWWEEKVCNDCGIGIFRFSQDCRCLIREFGFDSDAGG